MVALYIEFINISQKDRQGSVHSNPSSHDTHMQCMYAPATKKSNTFSSSPHNIYLLLLCFVFFVVSCNHHHRHHHPMIRIRAMNSTRGFDWMMNWIVPPLGPSALFHLLQVDVAFWY